MKSSRQDIINLQLSNDEVESSIESLKKLKESIAREKSMSTSRKEQIMARRIELDRKLTRECRENLEMEKNISIGRYDLVPLEKLQLRTWDYSYYRDAFAYSDEQRLAEVKLKQSQNQNQNSNHNENRIVESSHQLRIPASITRHSSTGQNQNVRSLSQASSLKNSVPITPGKRKLSDVPIKVEDLFKNKTLGGIVPPNANSFKNDPHEAAIHESRSDSKRPLYNQPGKANYYPYETEPPEASSSSSRNPSIRINEPRNQPNTFKFPLPQRLEKVNSSTIARIRSTDSYKPPSSRSSNSSANSKAAVSYRPPAQSYKSPRANTYSNVRYSDTPSTSYAASSGRELADSYVPRK